MPYWINDRSLKSTDIYLCAKGFGNPCGHSISATLFASLLIYEFKGPGIVLGLAWVSMISWARLLLGVNTLNQIIYGITLGINISCTIFYVFDYKRNVTRHFQKVIRGRFLEEKSMVSTKIFGAMAIMVLIYFRSRNIRTNVGRFERNIVAPMPDC